jgi:tetrathionate reductase subunit A
MAINRRDFLKYTTFGVTAVATGAGLTQWADGMFHYQGEYTFPRRPETWPNEEVKYSTCKQCHGDCGIMTRMFNGTLLNIFGNPYDIQTTEPNIKYSTPVKDSIIYTGSYYSPSEQPFVDGAHSVCPRGAAGTQTVYDPYRIYMPLKRVGERGSKKFKVISYKQLIDEVVNGGYLFKDVPGEEKRFVEGFKHLWNEGRNRFVPANPKYPDFGPKTNQFVSYWGRGEGGIANLMTRFANALGSVNTIPHVSICELSHHVSTFRTFPGTNMLKPDLPNCEYLLIFGANYLEANFPMQTLARRTVAATSSGKLKVTVIDVRAGNMVAHADRYVPIKPGGDGALAMGMLRWIIENKRYDENFLENLNHKAANMNGEPNFSNASYLVVTDESNKDFAKFLKSGNSFYAIDRFTNKSVLTSASEKGDLWPTGFLSLKPVNVNGVNCMTGMQMLWSELVKHSIDEYAKEAGLAPRVIPELAKGFTSHGKTAVADYYRGPVKHTNGFYHGRAIQLLNVMVGNVNWQGGYINGGGSANIMGGKGFPYNLGKWPGFVPAKGVKISREGSYYEKTMEYREKVARGVSPYPAERPWFPFSFGMWQEIWGGTYFRYPYPVKILFQQMGNPAWSMPGMGGVDDEARPWMRMIKDTNKVPLFIASDIMIAESSAYADYIVPDTTYLEGWGFLGNLPTYPTARTSIRQPVVEPMTEKTPDGRPICVENFLIDVAKALKLPGFGENAFFEGGNLNEREDYYLKMAANMAYDRKTFLKKRGNGFVHLGPVPDANADEMQYVKNYIRKHGEAIKPSEWKKVAYVIARGGRFEDYDVGYLPWGKPKWVTHLWGPKTPVNLYNDNVATTHNAITGERFNGTTVLLPHRNMKGEDLDKIYSRKEYPYMASTHRQPIHSKSRTMADPWLQELLPDAFWEIGAIDAKKLGLSDGDTIRVISPTYDKGIVHRVRIMPSVRPGVVTAATAFGRWLYGSGEWYINGKKYTGDPARNVGVHPNALFLLDKSIAAKDGWTTVLTDPVGGSMVYYYAPVKIEKV